MKKLKITADGRDITAAACAVTLTSSLDTLGASLTFEVPHSDIPRYQLQKIELGGTVRLYDNYTCVFIGKVTSVRTGANTRAYTCHDLGWYLNKSRITIQFTGITVTEAISAVFSEIGAHTGSIAEIGATVEDTCYLETPAAILDKLLSEAEDKTGQRYYIDTSYAPAGQDSTYFGVYKIGQLSTGASAAEPTGAEREESLENVVNRAVYVSGDSSGYAVETEAEDADSRERYGTISEVIAASEEDENAVEIVHNIVYAKANPIPTAHLECAGDFAVKAGHRFQFSDAVIGASGEWYVHSVTNTADGGEHRMQLNIVQLTESRRYTEEIKDKVESNTQNIHFNITGTDPRKDVMIYE